MTDSTASLPPGLAERWGIEVVALEVAIGDARYREGVDLPAGDLLEALTSGTRVTTSQPPPAAFAEAYARAADRGAREVVSVHLSGELSGTVRAAELAAAAAPVPVHVVDSRSVAMGLGFAALAAAEAAQVAEAAEAAVDGDGAAVPVGVDGAPVPGRAGVDGAAVAGRAGVDGAAVAGRARGVAAATSALFLVDSLEHLRRGGRIGAAAAAVGTLLGMRPLLAVRDGRVDVAGKVRTRRAARERLVALAVEQVAGRASARVAVHHLGQPEVADSLAAEVLARCGLRPGAVMVSEVSAVVGAHAGPGLLGVVVAGD
ncbi:DegV family protein [Cellulomonas aerilata]|uniref:DegV family protein n=1 Tax=Cellulomonas aerilata TaxID=515326 RepID=UPI001FEBB5B8|nr:DegV family protein [Cellulomonas aerilata]